MPLKVDPERLSHEEKQTIIECLKYVADLCDGAQALDGHGFNKNDTEIGKNLAYSNFHTYKMMVIAASLAWKYRGQLPDHLRQGIFDIERKHNKDKKTVLKRARFRTLL